MGPDRASEDLFDSLVDLVLHIPLEQDANRLLGGFVERAMQLTAARYGAIGVLRPDGGFGDFIHRGLTTEEVALLPHLPEGKGLLGSVLAERRPIRVDVISLHPDSIGFPIDHAAMHAFLGVPLVSMSKVVGGLYLTRGPGEGAFSDADEVAMTLLAPLAALAIEKTQLAAAEANRAERGHLMDEIAARVRRSLDIDEVCSATVELLGRSSGADRCFIRLSSPEDGNTKLGSVEFEWDAPGTRPLPRYPALKLFVADHAAETRQTQWSDDVTTHPHFEGVDSTYEMGNYSLIDVRAVLATPLEWGDELIGIIVFHSRNPRKWMPSDIALIEAAAREVAVGVHHARLYEEAVDTADKLRQVDQMRSDFVSMVSHELRSPMTVVGGIADVLEKRHDRLKSEQRSELIATLGREARRLRRLVSEILDLEALDQGGMRLELTEVDLSEVVREAVADSGERGRIRTVVEPGDTRVQADHDRIKQVLLNLISNAAKFSDDDDPIGVHLRPEGASVVIAVLDRGPGISQEDQKSLFQKFSRLDPTDTVKPGSGLGLYLSRAIIERHGGEIWCESDVGKGSTFGFRLPS